jgi:hypothetical protein
MRNFCCRSITSGGKAPLVVFLASLMVLFCWTRPALAAVGCSLNDPDRDIKRLFPESTGYRTEFVTIKDQGGPVLYEKVQKELGDNLDPVYEPIDVPYAFYVVLKGKAVAGIVHGVNQKGTYGGMQIILATNPKGQILSFYYQKMSSPEAAAFMNKKFTGQFTGLALENFLKGGLTVKDPSKGNRADFEATLRGIKKNLILLKELKQGGDAHHD